MEQFSQARKSSASGRNNVSSSVDKSASSATAACHAEPRPLKLPRFASAGSSNSTSAARPSESSPSSSSSIASSAVRPSALGTRPTSVIGGGVFSSSGGVSSLFSKGREGTVSTGALAGPRPDAEIGGVLGFGIFKGATCDTESGFFGSHQISKVSNGVGAGPERFGDSGIDSKFGNAVLKQAGSESAVESDVGAKFGKIFANVHDSEPAEAGASSYFSSDKKQGDVEAEVDTVGPTFQAVLNNTALDGGIEESSCSQHSISLTASATNGPAEDDHLNRRNEQPQCQRDDTPETASCTAVGVTTGGGGGGGGGCGPPRKVVTSKPKSPKSFRGVQRPTPASHQQQLQHQQQRRRPDTASVLRRPCLPKGTAISDASTPSESSANSTSGGLAKDQKGKNSAGDLRLRIPPVTPVEKSRGYAPESDSSKPDPGKAGASQNIESEGSSGGELELGDDEDDAGHSRDKLAQRQEWIRQKDAAKTRFRRECEAEIERVKSLMEHYIRDLEGMLDGDLVNALDDNLGQQIQDNYKEKVRPHIILRMGTGRAYLAVLPVLLFAVVDHMHTHDLLAPETGLGA